MHQVKFVIDDTDSTAYPLSVMKMPPEQMRKYVWEMIFKADGDRAKAADSMGISLRTLYRRLDELGLHDDLARMGWVQHKGPPRKIPRGASTVRDRILAQIRSNDGKISYAELTKELFAADTPDARTRLYAALDDLKRQRVIVQDKNDVWHVLEANVR